MNQVYERLDSLSRVEDIILSSIPGLPQRYSLLILKIEGMSSMTTDFLIENTKRMFSV